MNENQDPVFNPIENPNAVPADGMKTELVAAPNGGFNAQPAQGMGSNPTSYRSESPYGASADSLYFSADPPKKKHTGLFIGLGCLLIALLAAGGWWLLNNLRRDPFKDLKLAANRSLESYQDYLKELPNLYRYEENIIDFMKSDSKHAALNVSLSGIANVPDCKLQLSMDSDEKTKSALLRGAFEMQGMNIPAEIYADPDQIQIGSSTLLNEGEAFALPVKDFGKKWNSSIFSASAGKLPEDLSLSFLFDGFSEKSMKDTFGSDWTDFVKSVSYRKATAEDGESWFAGEGEVYVLTWDRDLLTKMGNKANTTMNAMNESNIKLDCVYPCAAIMFLSELNKGLDAPKFLVSDGMLVGVSIAGKDNKQAATYELMGEDNPWSRMRTTMFEKNDSTQKMEPVSTSEVITTIANGQMTETITQTSAGSDPKVVMEAVYNDADGSISYEVGDIMSEMPDYSEMSQYLAMISSMMENMDIHYTATEKTAKTDLVIDFEDVAFVGGKISCSFEFGGKADAIAPLSQKPTQLLDLDQTSLAMLVMRIQNKLNEITGGLN